MVLALKSPVEKMHMTVWVVIFSCRDMPDFLNLLEARKQLLFLPDPSPLGLLETCRFQASLRISPDSS